MPDQMKAYDQLLQMDPPLNVDSVWKLVQEQRMPSSAFIEYIEHLPSNGSRPNVFATAIGLALSSDAIQIARQLAERGHELYPDHAELNQLYRVLAKPLAISLRNQTSPEQAASMHWLNAHSQDYIGLWIALRGGELLGTAPTRKALMDHLRTSADDEVLITRIPDEF